MQGFSDAFIIVSKPKAISGSATTNGATLIATTPRMLHMGITRAGQRVIILRRRG